MDQVPAQHVDLLVLGWGKGGKTLAADAARRGLRVAVVEQSADMVGGSCINVACVPTKILIHESRRHRNLQRDDDGGVPAFAAAVDRRDALTAAMRAKNFDLLDGLDAILLVGGRARFTGPREVLVTGGPQAMRLTAESVLVSTGTRPALPPVPGAVVGGRVHDSRTVQHVDPLPGRLVVVGGGYVGLELAAMFAGFGTDVVVLDRGERPLSHEDEDVARTVTEVLADDGVRIVSGADVTRVDDDGAAACVTYEVAGRTQTVVAEAVLLAVGRVPETQDLGLELAGVETDEAGYVVVDEHLRSTAPGVFALGDVNGGPQFTYVSLDDARIVADQLFGDGARSTADRVAVPSTMFLTPPLARVGLTEAEARARGHEVLVGVRSVADLATTPRPKIEGEARGIVKVVVDAASDQVLGAALMHVHAQEVINLVATAMRHRVPASALRDAIYTHPSSSEVLNEILAALR